ncbi:hypothetical protein PF005_g8421 [Phytophthora fragariae]|uniref:PPM-type phosphatase domain-containing protein n=1 Tax=Phytophthora fragariae TaxID=53985 RepID=A0A6A3LB80_9STRA|nr:hypothetical protein PF003_g28266 [Phytophthora fragariae]KAE8941103.1 hypothetical protein PF009_g9090 [Phytophthora fragariae]KAE9016702.1 hypothetical protein PF011_g7027 [Phytophthora fragariae]KAE9119887.1 hypothetical protein PF007_g8371 [Phytophthora fragariae]KAE9119912.1 hypothetical protein PF010_g7685 [Phytophthora fragariae]
MSTSSRATHPVCFQSQWGDSGLGANVAVSGVSNIGATANRENQDAFFTLYDPKNAALVVGLFDGHGRDTGRDVAQAAKRYFEAQFQGYSHEDYARLQRDPAEFFHELFASCHQVLKYMLRDLYERAGHSVEEHQPDGFLVRHNVHTGTVASVRGGTTATIVVVLNGGQKIYSSNVGDSAALLISTWPGMQAEDVKVHGNDGADVHRQNMQLSDDSSEGNNQTSRSDLLLLSGNHSPESVTEFFRARSARCSPLDAALPALRFVYDSMEPKSRRPPVFTMSSNGELHRNPRGEYYKNVRDEWATVVAAPFTSLFPDALAFTRSLGDFHMHSYGVSCDPTVTELSLERVITRRQLATHSLDNQGEHHSDNTYSDEGVEGISEEPTFLLLVASDGVWDNWAFRDLHSFLCSALRNKTLQQQSAVPGEFDPVDAVVAPLLDANLQRANSYFGDQMDNMTAVLCTFNFRN